LAAIVEKAMAKDLDQRYQTADDMLEAVCAWRDTRAAAPMTIVPKGGGAPERARATQPRRPRRFALAALVVGLLVLLGAPLVKRELAAALGPPAAAASAPPALQPARIAAPIDPPYEPGAEGPPETAEVLSIQD
ncbi:MAG TPA: hypothetical protein VFH78_12250, partial [Candidatus Thermoplasmatota archaeon]|nr:hypothetical protein [Candidatus Thermoplasmatota archaeon]